MLSAPLRPPGSSHSLHMAGVTEDPVDSDTCDPDDHTQPENRFEHAGIWQACELEDPEEEKGEKSAHVDEQGSEHNVQRYSQVRELAGVEGFQMVPHGPPRDFGIADVALVQEVS